MFFTEMHFMHPSKAVHLLSLKEKLKRQFFLELDACYQVAGLETPYLTNYAACARVLNEVSRLLEEIEEGLHGGTMDEPECWIQSSSDFLAELKNRLR